MPLSTAERLTFLVQCPRCGQGTDKSVAWLASARALPCASPGCGNVIDLQSPENRALIQKLFDQASEVDAFLIASKETD